MSNDATWLGLDERENLWSALDHRGYAVTSDRSLGLPAEFRPTFSEAYFNEDTLRHDEGDWPVDRLRARDVIHYEWFDDHVDLHRHDVITITDRAGIPGKREHARVELLKDLAAESLIRTLLELVGGPAPKGR